MYGPCCNILVFKPLKMLKDSQIQGKAKTDCG